MMSQHDVTGLSNASPQGVLTARRAGGADGRLVCAVAACRTEL